MANCKWSNPRSCQTKIVDFPKKDYNVVVNGKEYKDLIWRYETPTLESALIAGYVCFYNEKVDIYIDGLKEK